MKRAVMTTRALRLAGWSAVLAAALGGTAWSAPPPLPTTDFVQAAAASDQFEMQEGRVAVVEARDPRVRAFAERMLAEHARTTQDLRQAAARSGSQPPTEGLSGDQAVLLGALQSQSGPEFDRTYMRHQVLGHSSALVVEQSYADGGGDPELRKTAGAMVPLIRRHLDEARGLLASLGG